MSTALEQLATGRTEAASVNLIAKEAGLSWGSVQNLFEDADGFWAAVVSSIIEAGPSMWAAPTSPTVGGRLAEVAELYLQVLGSPNGVAVETVRAALPRNFDVLVETHPRTAAALHDLDERWSRAFVRFLGGLDVDEERLRDVAVVLASGLRGFRTDTLIGAPTDPERARRTLVAALTAYLEDRT